MLSAMPGRTGIGQRELWPQAIQVDNTARVCLIDGCSQVVSFLLLVSELKSLGSIRYLCYHRNISRKKKI